MAEEHEFQAQENLRLCVNNCGFFGSPTTQNMCSNCYKDISVQKSVESSIISPSSSNFPAIVTAVLSPEKAAPLITAAPVMANRCSSCRKKVGLTGFRCRCGTTFCGTHRYPEKHGCTFDFKAVGREAIAKANPVIKADKLEKI